MKIVFTVFALIVIMASIITIDVELRTRKEKPYKIYPDGVTYEYEFLVKQYENGLF